MNKYVQRTLWVLTLGVISQVQAQIISVGSGSYTNRFPGTDAAGRNGFPSGKPFTVEKAALKPPPSNDWWSAKIKNAHCDNLFNYPFTMKTVSTGLVVTYIPWGVIDDIQPIIMGVSGMSAAAAEISDFSDWTIQMRWKKQNSIFRTTTGVGMPFLYFEKDSQSTAQITVNSGTVTIKNNRVIIENARNGGDFVVYGPSGSTWTQNGTVLTSSLNGKNYWSMALLPHNSSNLETAADNYEKYAFVFPVNTLSSYHYNETQSRVETHFKVDVDVKEGTDSAMLMGLLPHQWAHLYKGATDLTSTTYRTVRGDLKMLSGNSFATQHPFRGILPTLPYVNPYSKDFNPLELKDKIESIMNDGLAEWTDSYNEGQVMNRLIQTARIAHEMQLDQAVSTIVKTVKNRLEDWLSAESGERAFLFYYDSTWKSLLGYPAGHGQDNNLNDHHFHWGYFIHAASFLEEFEPGWAAKWGAMINLLVRDAASTDRTDPLFSHLRNFNPYQGHCWANGFASFPQGNDQESTSESMQFNSSLIHWGSVIGDTAIRNLGIYLYATEQAAVEEYWFDKNKRNFAANQAFALVSRVWGNSYDNGTFWTADIAASYGIELYPIHGGSLYLAHDTTYVRRLWNEMAKNTGILTNQANDNLWHDVYWSYLAFIDAPRAIKMYNSFPNRNLKFGISDAQTYHWLHALNALGRLDTSIKSNHPLAVAFNHNGDKTYVAKNYSKDTLYVTFSDGFKLKVAPSDLATNKDIQVKGKLQSDFPQAYYNGSVNLELAIEEGTPDRVVFYNGGDSIGQVTTAPFKLKTPALKLGWNDLSARMYQGSAFAISNFVRVRVGETKAFGGNIPPIPGSIQSGHFDEFEGGVGQGLTYLDLSRSNLGDFRPEEYVDASNGGTEGAIVTWIDPNEWLDYTVDVTESGRYDVQIRYASNESSSGPIQMELNGEEIAKNISFTSSGGWEKWGTKTVTGVPLKKGIHTLRLNFVGGRFNLGKLTFTKKSDLNIDYPIAEAGTNIWVNPTDNTFDLKGSGSSGTAPLTYKWTQLYGPSKLTMVDHTDAQTGVSGFEKGVYKCQLEVSDGTYFDKDEVFIVVSEDANTPPSVAISSPSNGTEIWENQALTIKVAASDLIGSVAKVTLWVNGVPSDSSIQAPYQFTKTWSAGTYQLLAQATDDSGAVAYSAMILVKVDELPSCRFPSANGDFDVVFSNDKSNPTATFVPKKSGTGTPTCILYYSTNMNSMPGYIVKPNVAFRITAAAGSTIYYYYTYSFTGGEKNTADKKGSFAVGLCKPEAQNSQKKLDLESIQVYPNPATDWLQVRVNGSAKVQLFSVSGEAVSQQISIENEEGFDVSALTAGYYVVRVELADGRMVYRAVIIE